MKQILSIYLFLVATISFAQVKDTTVQFNGKEYCIHAIQKGETLFQLSRTYQVAYSLIKEANPEYGDALALGTPIRIPCKNVKKAKKQLNETVEKNEAVSTASKDSIGRNSLVKKLEQIVEDEKKKVNETDAIEDSVPEFIYHPVLPKETLYSLSKKYELSKLRIMMDNPQVAKDGLKIGDTLKIFKGYQVQNLPDLVSFPNPTSSIINLDSAFKDSTVFRLALLMPFEFQKNKIHLVSDENKEDPSLLEKTSFFIEFYQGLQLGLDSIARKGNSIQAFVFDTKADTNEIFKIINAGKVDAMDMIIGPAFSENFAYASNLLKNKNTYLVSPYGKGKKIVEGNPKSIKVRTSKRSRVKVLADYLYANRKNNNLIFVYEKDSEKELLEKLQQELMSLSLLKDSIVMPSPFIVKGIYEPLAKLKNTESNVLVCFSSDESFSTKLVAKLQTRHKDYEISLFGMEEWKDYKNIEIVHWKALDIHLVGNLDFRYTGVKDSIFFSTYFKRFNTEPSYHALLGYETVLSVLANLENNTYLHSQIVGSLKTGDLGNYRYKYNAGNTGVENRAGSVYKYKNFKFQKVQ